MSEIPFVNRLGDAIDVAAARPEPAGRRRRRRLGGLTLAVFLLGAGGVTIAQILDDPEKLATGSLACYDRADRDDANVHVLAAAERDPLTTCARLLRMPAGQLVACVAKEHIAVFPGRGPCEDHGLRPLPAEFAVASERVARLARDVRAVESRGDCIAPAELVRRVQAVLDRTGWDGWRVVLAGGEGRCGRIDGLSGALDPNRRVIVARRGPPRSLDRLVDGTYETLLVASGRRCFTLAALRARARRELPVPVRFRLETGPLPEFEELLPESRDRRFREGCAVFETAEVAPSETIVVTLRMLRR